MMRHGFFLCAVFFLAHAAPAQTITSTVEGVVVPARAWDVSAEISNKIGGLHFIEGQIVAEGDLLVEFDTGFKLLELDLAEARLAEAEVAVSDVLRRILQGPLTGPCDAGEIRLR
jgi:multidrug efflux pump subunit AcrA (membrane-fusion protein)